MTKKNDFNILWNHIPYDIKLTLGIKCPRCNTTVNEYMKYCYECGKKLIIPIEEMETEIIKCHGKQITVPKGTFEKILNDNEDEESEVNNG